MTRSRLSIAYVSSSFKWLDTFTFASTIPTFITQVLHRVTYFTTAVLNECYSEVMAYTALAYSCWASFHDAYIYAYVMPTVDTEYSCHIKAIELI